MKEKRKLTWQQVVDHVELTAAGMRWWICNVGKKCIQCGAIH